MLPKWAHLSHLEIFATFKVPSQKLCRPNPVGIGRIRSDSVGIGRIWSDSVGFGWIRSEWSDLVGFGRIRTDSVGVASGRGPLLGFFREFSADFPDLIVNKAQYVEKSKIRPHDTHS